MFNRWSFVILICTRKRERKTAWRCGESVLHRGGSYVAQSVLRGETSQKNANQKFGGQRLHVIFLLSADGQSHLTKYSWSNINWFKTACVTIIKQLWIYRILIARGISRLQANTIIGFWVGGRAGVWLASLAFGGNFVPLQFHLWTIPLRHFILEYVPRYLRLIDWFWTAVGIDVIFQEPLKQRRFVYGLFFARINLIDDHLDSMPKFTCRLTTCVTTCLYFSQKIPPKSTIRFSTPSIVVQQYNCPAAMAPTSNDLLLVPSSGAIVIQRAFVSLRLSMASRG